MSRYHLLNREDVQYVPSTERFLKYIVIFLSVTAIGYWYFSSYNSETQSHFYQPNEVKSKPSLFDVDSFIKSWNKRKHLCSTPEILDYMLDDPFIQKYTKNVSLQCNKTNIYTKLDQTTGIVRLTKNAIEDRVSCSYSFLWRTFEQDNFIDYSGIDPIPRSGIQMTNENDIANVSCTKNGEQVYKNTHLWIRDLKPKVEPQVKGPSVAVIFLESLSSVSYNRYMKKTRIAMENLGNIHYLKGFVKHNDNSFPNSVSFLTGMRVDWDYEEKVFKHTYFDEVEPKVKYLWDDFSSRGYVTGFLEDMAIVGIFNYAKWGWKTSPTDWNPRAFWVQMYPESGSFKIWDAMNLKEQFCFNEPKVDIFLNQVHDFMVKMKKLDQPYFLYAFYSQMTHDDINNYQIVDEPFANFFGRTKGMYNDTLLIFAGDHGPRYGSPSVPSGFGRLEERMNLVSIRVPESLDAKYPHLKKFLAANEDKLSSWADIHSLVGDIARGSYDPVTSVTKKVGPISPWRELVHPDRTCNDAYVYSAYCVCNGTMNTDFRSPEKYDMYWSYKAIQDYVNKLIAEAKDSEPEVYGRCDDNQKVNTTFIDMKYILPKVGENFMTDRMKIKVFLEPANVYLSTIITVKHHKDHFVVNDDEFRVLDIVCKRESME